MRDIDVDTAVGTYWSLNRVGVFPEDIVAAWSQAAEAVWKDECHVTSRGGVTCADFLFNSGHVRMTVARCALRVAPLATGTSHFLTVVTFEIFGLNLGWALHTRTLDATWGEDWMNPTFGEQAVRKWENFERG